MVNRNAKNGYKIVKKDHINVACELSLSDVNVPVLSRIFDRAQYSFVAS